MGEGTGEDAGCQPPALHHRCRGLARVNWPDCDAVCISLRVWSLFGHSLGTVKVYNSTVRTVVELYLRRTTVAGRNGVAIRWTGLFGPPANFAGDYFLGLGDLAGFISRQLAVDLWAQNKVP